MINAGVDFAAAIAGSSRRFRFRLFDSSDTQVSANVRSATVHLGSCGPDEFSIGAVFSSYADIVLDGQDLSIEGEELRLSIGVLTDAVNNTYADMDLGYFTALTPKATKYRTTFTAVGRISSKLAPVDFVAPSTQTLAAVAGAIQTLTGVTVLFESGIDTTSVIEHPITGTCRDALAVLAHVVGGYATETNTGSVLISKYSTTVTAEYSTSRMASLPEMGDYDFEITGVQAVTSTGIFEDGDPINVTVDSDYITEDLFDAWADALIGLQYRPGTVPLTLGDPRIEPSDALHITTADNNEYIVPCMSIVHIYDGGLQTEISTPSVMAIGEVIGTMSKAVKEAVETAKKAAEDVDDARKVAINYLSRDNTGIMVADMSGGTTYTPSTAPTGVKNTKIDSDSFDVRDGQKVLASFGETSQVGEDEKAHVVITKNQFSVYGHDGSSNVSNIGTRNDEDSGLAVVTEEVPEIRYISNVGGHEYYVIFASATPTEIIRCTVNGIDVDASFDYTLIYSADFHLHDSAVVVYTTRDIIPFAAFNGAVNDGYRALASGMYSIAQGVDSAAFGSGAQALGPYSFAEGLNTKAIERGTHAEGNDTTASGEFAHAEGGETEASGLCAHAEGDRTIASDSCAHAEGLETEASEISSHAQNYGTIASQFAQTALGKCNVEDTNNKYAAIIGNGTENARSNALAVTWDGNVELALDINAAANTQDGKLYAVITALGLTGAIV